MYRHRQNFDESIDLGKYIGHGEQDHKDEQYHHHPKNLHTQQLHMQISRLNMKLQSICTERIGDLTNNTSIKQMEKTLQLVQTLISQIKRHQEAKVKIINERRQAQQNLVQAEQTIQKLVREKKTVQNQKQNLFSRLKNLQKTYKQSVQKSQIQKQDLTKQIKQLQLRQKGFEAQFRKKQNLIKGLQDGIKKFQDKTPFKNSFDIMQKLQYGPNIYDLCNTNGQNEYSRLAKDAKDEQCKRLTEQNQHLKQCLTNIYKQLNTVLELKRQTLKNKKGYDGQYESYFQLNSFRPQTLHLPENWSRQKLKQLNQNIQKFKQAIKVGDYSDARVDERKETCVNGIKNLIKNYKQVVQTQDQLLNKVLLKSKQFKATELAHIQNRFSKVLDNNQLDRAKRFVQQQTQYLLSKDAELQKTRKMMQTVMKKAEQSKKQMVRQRQIFQDETLQMRRNLETLPAMIQQQLTKTLN